MLVWPAVVSTPSQELPMQDSSAGIDSPSPYGVVTFLTTTIILAIIVTIVGLIPIPAILSVGKIPGLQILDDPHNLVNNDGNVFIRAVIQGNTAITVAI